MPFSYKGLNKKSQVIEKGRKIRKKNKETKTIRKKKKSINSRVTSIFRLPTTNFPTNQTEFQFTPYTKTSCALYRELLTRLDLGAGNGL